MGTNYIGREEKKEGNLEEIIRGLLTVPGPEGSTLYGQGEALKGYATPLKGKQEDVTAEDLGKIDVRKSFGEGKKKGNGGNKLMEGVGTGLVKFLQSTGHGMSGKPIDMAAKAGEKLGERGWESYLGATIGSKLGAGLIAGALSGGEAANRASAAAEPTFYNTPQEMQKRTNELTDYAQKEAIRTQVEKRPSWGQGQEMAAVLAALHSGKYALKGDFTGELARQDMKTFDDALSFVTYKGIDPNDPAIIEALKKYPVMKNGKPVGKFAGFDTDGEILVE